MSAGRVILRKNSILHEMGTAVLFQWVVALGLFAFVVGFIIWVARHRDEPVTHRPDPLEPDTQAGSVPLVVAEKTRAPLVVPKTNAQIVTQNDAPIRSRSEILRRFHAQVATDSSGAPISSENRAAWLEARRYGVTATDVGKIVKLNGTFSSQRAGLMEAKLSGREAPFQQVMQHGIDREPVIATWVAEKFGIEPNTLLCRGHNPRHLATPDGIGAGVAAEI